MNLDKQDKDEKINSQSNENDKGLAESTNKKSESGQFKKVNRIRGKINKKKYSKKQNFIDKRKLTKFGRNKNSKKKEIIDQKKLKKYYRGKPTGTQFITSKREQKKIANREQKIQFGVEQSVKSECLLTEDSGFLEPDEDEVTTQFTQKQIKDSVDPLSASKGFELDLKFGSYRMNYSRNGRYLLLGGRRGHVAALDWISKKLLCEMNVMEETFDVTWFHQETMFAVAQKKWVYIYDNQGTEIHCLKPLHNIYRILFLPYHFLLAALGSKGYIHWLDVSIGKMVQQFPTTCHGKVSTVALHPGNAMICIGEPNGVVSFWGPNSKKPAIIKWCHKKPITAVAFDPRGEKFTTAALGGEVKIWDARNLNGPLQHYFLRCAPRSIAISHRGVMAFALETLVEVYNEKIIKGMPTKQIYLRHKVPGSISNMEFCPFEDILGVAHSSGFCSMLVPGCGEANFDALEINPFQTKSQRREAEVKALLGKIPSDLISWDSNELLKVNLPTTEEIMQTRKQLANIKAPNIQITPRHKTGRKSGSVSILQRKKIMKEEFRRSYIKEVKQLKNEGSKKTKKKPESPVTSVLDRFKKKQST